MTHKGLCMIGIGNLQSVDWNGGIANLAKNEVKRSQYCAIFVPTIGEGDSI